MKSSTLTAVNSDKQVCLPAAMPYFYVGSEPGSAAEVAPRLTNNAVLPAAVEMVGLTQLVQPQLHKSLVGGALRH